MISNNKRRIISFIILILELILVLPMLLFLQRIVKNKIPLEMLQEPMPLFLFFLLMIIILYTKGKMVFEYEITSEVFSIKSYQWYLMNRKRILPVLEMPKKSLVKFKIEKVFFKRYLLLFFKVDSGKIITKRIDISGCSLQEIRELQLRFNLILNFNNHGT